MSKSYKAYIIETSLYGILGMLMLILTPILFLKQKFLTSLVTFLMALVCFDNFFCGSRIKKTGKTCNSHYAIPLFLKKKRSK
ncbi:hypothetical protein GOV05_00130 [Candidatus Woesearchaeota archaeon]|nr:hypothetical protein [Candidatus Woesearchaeota archaeon]